VREAITAVGASPPPGTEGPDGRGHHLGAPVIVDYVGVALEQRAGSGWWARLITAGSVMSAGRPHRARVKRT
jgi:hypothetical protein